MEVEGWYTVDIDMESRSLKFKSLKSIATAGLIFGVLGILGCATKQPDTLMREIRAKNGKFKSFRNSRSLTFQRGLEEEFVVVATYVGEDEQKNEKFLLAISDIDLDIDSVKLSLNGKEVKSFKKVEKSSLSKSVANIIPSWSNLYACKFAPQDAKKLTLKIVVGKESREIIFYKKLKYLIEKKRYLLSAPSSSL